MSPGDINPEIRERIIRYCDYYDVPLNNLPEILEDLKVIPMIRGKGFEFFVSNTLQSLVDTGIWSIDNPNINAQSEVHDVDVVVTSEELDKTINIECKLAGKDTFRIERGIARFKVKCMRSRTISDNDTATRMARRYGIGRDILLNHRDNYREDDFDFVITSMGNSLWTTIDKRYTFRPRMEYLSKLKRLFPDHFNHVKNMHDFQKQAFSFLLIAESSDITVTEKNNITCSRRGCIRDGTHYRCGFIPNYPIINLDEVSRNDSPWKIVQDTDLNELFRDYQA
ncbi:MAG: hypothetical protein ACTSX1_04735 [Candidatus Heimdallarchaeaceae archaeon]